jgi:hypothetical protein
MLKKPDFMHDIVVQRYYKEGEKEAEPFALQPVLYYLLTLAAIVSFVLALLGVI